MSEPSESQVVGTDQMKINVVACRIDKRDLDAIDALIEAGIRSTRSDAAAWLIHAGIEANKGLFEKVEGTVAEIRRLRLSVQQLVLDNEASEANISVSEAQHGADEAKVGAEEGNQEGHEEVVARVEDEASAIRENFSTATTASGAKAIWIELLPKLPPTKSNWTSQNYLTSYCSKLINQSNKYLNLAHRMDTSKVDAEQYETIAKQLQEYAESFNRVLEEPTPEMTQAVQNVWADAEKRNSQAVEQENAIAQSGYAVILSEFKRSWQWAHNW